MRACARRWEAANGLPGMTSLYLGVMDALYAINPDVIFFVEGASQLPSCSLPHVPFFPAGLQFTERGRSFSGSTAWRKALQQKGARCKACASLTSSASGLSVAPALGCNALRCILGDHMFTLLRCPDLRGCVRVM